jgi:CDP-glycerol glycerophosphotransferase
MRAAIRGDVPTGPFDAEEYNRRAMNEFYRAIGAENSPANDVSPS